MVDTAKPPPDPRQPLNIGALLQQSLIMPLRLPLLLLVSAGVMFVILALVGSAVFGSMFMLTSIGAQEGEDIAMLAGLGTLGLIFVIVAGFGSLAPFYAILSVGYVSVRRRGWRGVGATAMAGVLRTGHVAVALASTSLAYIAAIVPGVVIGSFTTPALTLPIVAVGIAFCATTFAVALPAAAIEGAMLTALTRSAALTSGYRWSVLGLVVAILLILTVLSMAASAVVVGTMALGAVGGILGQILNLMLAAYGYGVLVAFSALTYARLTEIKEGGAGDGTAEIFS